MKKSTSQNIRNALRAFAEKMQTYDNVPDGIAADALAMVTGVTDALSNETVTNTEDESEREECKKTEDETVEEMTEKVTDSVIRQLRELGVIRDEKPRDKAMAALDALEIEEKETEDEETEEAEEIVEDECDPEKAADDARELLKILRPHIAVIKDDKKRKAAADALARALRQSWHTSDGYSKAVNIVSRNVKAHAQDAKTFDRFASAETFGDEIFARYNPHAKKEVK